MHELSAIRLPLPHQVARILSGARLKPHQNTALANALFVFLDAPFGNAPFRKRPYQCARKADSPGSGQGCDNGSSSKNAQYGNEQESAHSSKRRGNRADRPTGGPTQFVGRLTVFRSIFCSIAAQIRFGVVPRGEVSVARLLGHEYVDIRVLIAQPSCRSISTLGTFLICE